MIRSSWEMPQTRPHVSLVSLNLYIRLDVHDHWQLFLFLFLFLERYLNVTRASLQTSRPLFQHRTKPLRVHTKSVYIRTKSANFASDPSSACYRVWDPWPAEYQPCDMNNTAIQMQHSCFSFTLTSSSRTCSGTLCSLCCAASNWSITQTFTLQISKCCSQSASWNLVW